MYDSEDWTPGTFLVLAREIGARNFLPCCEPVEAREEAMRLMAEALEQDAYIEQTQVLFKPVGGGPTTQALLTKKTT